MNISNSDSSENKIHRRVQLLIAHVYAVQSQHQSQTIDNNGISIGQQENENFQITSQLNTSGPSGGTLVTTKTTNAQRCKTYREKRQLENSSTLVNPFGKTTAQRMKEYRERKKIIQERNLPKTAAQRMKEYRERKKKMQQPLVMNNLPDTAEQEKKKTNAQRCKAYRERQKIQNSYTLKNPHTKTVAQRMKEYRKRKTQRQSMQESNLDIDKTLEYCTKLYGAKNLKKKRTRPNI